MSKTLTLYNRIEPFAKNPAAPPPEAVSAMTFCGDMAVFWATIPGQVKESPGMIESTEARREARVVFGGMMYRFQDNSENRLAMAEFMKGPTNEQPR